VATNLGTVELKIPAEGPFVVVAKRAAGALASAAGFSLEDIDDLNIAVAQACEKAIAAGERIWGTQSSVLRLTFRLYDGGMEVEVKGFPASREGAVDDSALQREVDQARRDATKMRQAAQRLTQEVAIERQERMLAQGDANRLRSAAAARSMAPARVDTALDTELEDVAVDMIRLFVDELRYNVDSRGSMRMRMVKYLVD
jgi:serine/threonine-protein kinase RsbW